MMDELDHGWDAQEEWHPMFRAYMDQIKWRFKRDDERRTWTYGSWMDYSDYWDQRRDLGEGDRWHVPDVWR